MYKFSYEQLSELAKHIEGIVRLKIAAWQNEPEQVDEVFEVDEGPYGGPIATGIRFADLQNALDTLEHSPSDEEWPPRESESSTPLYPDWDELERVKRERLMSRMCGRWTAGENRGGVEITRRGEHLTLTYLKRNGQPFGERFVLLWFDKDSLIYYGHCDRMSSVTHDAATDTLMTSPRADYTRVTES